MTAVRQIPAERKGREGYGGAWEGAGQHDKASDAGGDGRQGGGRAASDGTEEQVGAQPGHQRHTKADDHAAQPSAQPVGRGSAVEQGEHAAAQEVGSQLGGQGVDPVGAGNGLHLLQRLFKGGGLPAQAAAHAVVLLQQVDVGAVGWHPADLGRFMVFFGPISSIFDILTFCLMWWVFHANTPETQTLFQSGWFVVGLLSQTLIVHMIRTRRVPFIQSCASWPLMIMTVIVMIVGIALPFSPLASYLQLQALPLSYFPWLVAILAGYMTLTQLVKGFYSRRYGWQ